MAPDHPLVRCCVPLGCTVETVYRKWDRWLGRILRLPELLAALAPEWQALLDSSPLAGWRGTIGFDTDLGRAIVSVRSDGIHVTSRGRAAGWIKASQADLFQLIMGYRTTGEVAAEGRAKIGSKLLPLAGILFPRRNVHIWRADGF